MSPIEPYLTARQSLEPAAKLLIGGGEIFGDHARLSDCGHEVCVAHPSGHNVNMDMIDNSCARRVAKVHANIESIRLISFA